MKRHKISGRIDKLKLVQKAILNKVCESLFGIMYVRKNVIYSVQLLMQGVASFHWCLTRCEERAESFNKQI